MSNSVSTLDRLAQERGFLVTYNRAPTKTSNDLWVVNVTTAGKF